MTELTEERMNAMSRHATDAMRPAIEALAKQMDAECVIMADGDREVYNITMGASLSTAIRVLAVEMSKADPHLYPSILARPDLRDFLCTAVMRGLEEGAK